MLPWFTRTDMVEKVLEDRAFEEKLLAAAPPRRARRHRPGRRFLALPDSDYITGQLLAVDGGYLAQGL